ncbi:hypothetical protein SELMODRAFT_430311 [Selaginella moellendorffii]|uniref:Uncharacterized protein n=1 Tax=Selaginella moellendorffii TaxID=88036 RepID=D8T902_SELML|nr:hypothetical protein SELMODRAFT_430311 [Selaginella moellendorffii]
MDLRDLVAEKLYSTLNSSREETKANVAVFNKALQDTTAEAGTALRLCSQFAGALPTSSLSLPLATAFALALSPLSVEAILDCVRAQYKSLLAPLEVYLSKLGYQEPEANRVAASILDGAGSRILANWRRVFRSIFWTKLMRLNSEPLPTVYLLREMSFHRDEVGDFEKSLVFASWLQGGDVPESIQEKIVSFVEPAVHQGDRVGRRRGSATSDGTDELVARRLDENTQAAATGLEEIPRPWTEDTKLLVLMPEGIGLEVLEVTSPRSSSSDSYKSS